MVLIIWYSLSHTVSISMPLTETSSDIKAPGYIDNDNVYDLKHAGISDETINVHTEPVIFEPH